MEEVLYSSLLTGKSEPDKVDWNRGAMSWAQLIGGGPIDAPIFIASGCHYAVGEFVFAGGVQRFRG